MTDTQRPDNPYLASMRDLFGGLSASEEVIALHIPALSARISAEAEALADRISAGVSDGPAPPSSGTQATDQELLAAVREEILVGLLDSLRVAQGDPNRFAYLAGAVRWGVTPEPPPFSEPHAEESPGDAGDEGFEDWLSGHLDAPREQFQGLGEEVRSVGRAIAQGALFGHHGAPLESGAMFPLHGEELQNGSVWLRLMAFLYDWLASIFLGLVAGMVLAASGSPYDAGTTVLVGYAMLFAWTILCALSIHRWATTPGKAVFGLGVIPITEVGRLSVGRALLRETVGRVVNGVFYLGYITALSHPLKRTWADRMAHSWVVRRPVARRVRASLALAGALAATFVAVLMGVRSDVPDPVRLEQTIEAEADSIGAFRDSIATLSSRPVKDTDEYRQDMLALLDAVAAYEPVLSKTRSHFRQSARAGLLPWGRSHQILQAADSLMGVLQRQAALEKEAAQLALIGGFDDSGRPRYWHQIRYARSDIAALDLERERLVRELGPGSE